MTICCESSRAETGVEKCDCAGEGCVQGGMCREECAGEGCVQGVCVQGRGVCRERGCVRGLRSSVSREEGSKVHVCAKMERSGERH